MQQRRFRPGDVLDDYCPRERRITDHAIVAMIDDHIKQTRCVVCDAEHEYKDGKVPAQRRKKPQAALFAQVLEGLQGPQPVRLAHSDSESDLSHPDPARDLPVLPSVASLADASSARDAVAEPTAQLVSSNGRPSEAVETFATPVDRTDRAEGGESDDSEVMAPRDEGPVRRPLIRATLPRPEGTPPATRAMPEFTIRQPGNARGGQRPGGRRRGHTQQGHGHPGPMRFGRGGGTGQGQGQGQGQRQHGRHQGPNGGRPGGNRRGGKKR